MRGRERFWFITCLVLLVIGWHTYYSLALQLLHLFVSVR
jgi:hypothetical protein